MGGEGVDLGARCCCWRWGPWRGRAGTIGAGARAGRWLGRGGRGGWARWAVPGLAVASGPGGDCWRAAWRLVMRQALAGRDDCWPGARARARWRDCLCMGVCWWWCGRMLLGAWRRAGGLGAGGGRQAMAMGGVRGLAGGVARCARARAEGAGGRAMGGGGGRAGWAGVGRWRRVCARWGRGKGCGCLAMMGQMRAAAGGLRGRGLPGGRVGPMVMMMMRRCVPGRRWWVRQVTGDGMGRCGRCLGFQRCDEWLCWLPLCRQRGGRWRDGRRRR